MEEVYSEEALAVAVCLTAGVYDEEALAVGVGDSAADGGQVVDTCTHHNNPNYCRDADLRHNIHLKGRKRSP